MVEARIGRPEDPRRFSRDLTGTRLAIFVEI
jgi:hypothetical protein